MCGQQREREEPGKGCKENKRSKYGLLWSSPPDRSFKSNQSNTCFLFTTNNWKVVKKKIKKKFIFPFFFVSPASVPSLTHLCRLEIRSRVKPEHLRSDSFICQLPLPRSLHNYLLYAEVLRMNEIPELAVQDEEISEAT